MYLYRSLTLVLVFSISFHHHFYKQNVHKVVAEKCTKTAKIKKTYSCSWSLTSFDEWANIHKKEWNQDVRNEDNILLFRVPCLSLLISNARLNWSLWGWHCSEGNCHQLATLTSHWNGWAQVWSTVCLSQSRCFCLIDWQTDKLASPCHCILTNSHYLLHLHTMWQTNVCLLTF